MNNQPHSFEQEELDEFGWDVEELDFHACGIDSAPCPRCEARMEAEEEREVMQ